MVLGKFSVPLVWKMVGQGTIELAVGAVGGCLNLFFFSRLSVFFSFFLFAWETAPFVKPKITNQPINQIQPRENTSLYLLPYLL